MLSGILDSERAINANIAIMRASVEIRKVLRTEDDNKEELKLKKERLGDHDAQLNQIDYALENLWMKKRRNEIGMKEQELVLRSD